MEEVRTSPWIASNQFNEIMKNAGMDIGYIPDAIPTPTRCHSTSTIVIAYPVYATSNVQLTPDPPTCPFIDHLPKL